MLTRNEGERLAQAVHSLRKDWPYESLRTFIGNRKERPMLDLALELVYVALDPESQSPARIDVDGPWKRLRHHDRPIQHARSVSSDDCDICHKPRGPICDAIRAVDGHEYRPINSSGSGTKPTVEQRALMDAAVAEAKAHAAAVKEAAEKREPAPVDQVLARHQSDE